MNLFRKVTEYKSDFTTYAREFKGYRWYKPILVLVLTLILSSVFSLLIPVILSALGIPNATSHTGYNGLNTYTTDGLVTLAQSAIMVPSFLMAAKIVNERPISSYLYSRKNWNWKLFTYPFLITVAVLIIPSVYLIITHGLRFNNHFTLLTLLLTVIMVPLQCWGEEFLFRSTLMQAFGSWFKIPVLAIILQAVLFMLVHPYNLIGQIDVFLAGIFYAVLAWRTKGLEATMATHAANNLFLLILLGVDLYVLETEVSIEMFILSAVFKGITTVIILALNKKYGWSQD